jgi:hypothetical protein
MNSRRLMRPRRASRPIHSSPSKLLLPESLMTFSLR